MRYIILSPFYRWGSRGIEKLYDLPKVTQLITGRGRIQTQAVWLQSKKPTNHARKRVESQVHLSYLPRASCMSRLQCPSLWPLATCLRGKFARYTYLQGFLWCSFDSTFMWKRDFGGRELGEWMSFAKTISILPCPSSQILIIALLVFFFLCKFLIKRLSVQI